MKKNLEYQDENVSKFWQIEVTGRTLIIISGNVGATGRTQAKSFADDTACMEEAGRLVAGKIQEGYVEKDDNKAVISTRQPAIVARPPAAPAYGTVQEAAKVEAVVNNLELKDNQIVVDLDNVDDLNRVLSALVSDIDHWNKVVADNGGLFYGQVDNNEFKAYGDGSATGSENAFWATAVSHETLLPLVEAYVRIVNPNQWFSNDVRMGMAAVYHLALNNKQFLPLFIEFHRNITPGGGLEQLAHITDLMDNSDEGICLLAACCTYEIDNEDIDVNIEHWINEYIGNDVAKKELLFRYMLLQTATSKRSAEYRPERFMDALIIMDVDYDELTLRYILGNPLDVTNLPTLNSLKAEPAQGSEAVADETPEQAPKVEEEKADEIKE